MQNRSTITNLLCVTQDLAETIDNNGKMDVIYTDMQKAFDTINHQLLLKKMSLLDFSDSLLALVRSYLMNRQHCVRYCNCMSNSFVLTSGVPQGSNLGSLLFLTFINDLPANVSCNKLLFADDLKLYHRIYSVNDCLALQHNANVLSFWSRTNLLQINEPKCYVMSYTKQKCPVSYPYKINDYTISRTDSFKDLGVIFDNLHLYHM